jgi:hypothetical protein
MIGQTDVFHRSPAPRYKTFQAFLIYFPKCPVSVPRKAMLKMWHFTSFFLNFQVQIAGEGT